MRIHFFSAPYFLFLSTASMTGEVSEEKRKLDCRRRAGHSLPTCPACKKFFPKHYSLPTSH